MTTPETSSDHQASSNPDLTVATPDVITPQANIDQSTSILNSRPIWKWLSLGLVIIIVLALAGLAASLTFFDLKISLGSPHNAQVTPTPTGSPQATPTPPVLPAGWSYQTSSPCQLKIALPPKHEPYTEMQGQDLLYWKYNQYAFDNKVYIATPEQKALDMTYAAQVWYTAHEGQPGDGYGSTVEVYCSQPMTTPKSVEEVADLYTEAYEQIPPTEIQGPLGSFAADPNKITSRYNVMHRKLVAVKLDRRYYDGFSDEYLNDTVAIMVTNDRYYIAKYNYWKGYPEDFNVGRTILETIAF